MVFFVSTLFLAALVFNAASAAPLRILDTSSVARDVPVVARAEPMVAEPMARRYPRRALYNLHEKREPGTIIKESSVTISKVTTYDTPADAAAAAPQVKPDFATTISSATTQTINPTPVAPVPPVAPVAPVEIAPVPSPSVSQSVDAAAAAPTPSGSAVPSATPSGADAASSAAPTPTPSGADASASATPSATPSASSTASASSAPAPTPSGSTPPASGSTTPATDGTTPTDPSSGAVSSGAPTSSAIPSSTASSVPSGAPTPAADGSAPTTPESAARRREVKPRQLSSSGASWATAVRRALEESFKL